MNGIDREKLLDVIGIRLVDKEDTGAGTSESAGEIVGNKKKRGWPPGGKNKKKEEKMKQGREDIRKLMRMIAGKKGLKKRKVKDEGGIGEPDDVEEEEGEYLSSTEGETDGEEVGAGCRESEGDRLVARGGVEGEEYKEEKEKPQENREENVMNGVMEGLEEIGRQQMEQEKNGTDIGKKIEYKGERKGQTWIRYSKR